MGSYIVIYDPSKEIAAVVDADNRIGFGPAMIGPDAERALNEFLESIDYDVSAVDSAVLRDWFEGWAGEHFQPSEAVSDAGGNGSVGADPNSGMDGAALAQAEAAAAGDPPPGPQPADTDAGASPGATGEVTGPLGDASEGSVTNGGDPPPYTGTCFACNGTGSVTLMVDEPPVICSACRGTGHLPAPVA